VNSLANTLAAPLPALLPSNAELQRVGFPERRAANQSVLVEFPPPINRVAVLRGSGASAAKEPLTPGEVLLLAIPGQSTDNEELTAQVRTWATGSSSAPSHIVMLQGAHIVWGDGHIAVFAQADRLDAVRKALIESAYYEMELRALERDLGEMWPDMEKDTPLAFEFREKSLRVRRQLSERFRQLLLLRARLERVSPNISLPHVHPPTLASQIGERMRERLRMAHRTESLSDQLEVFERIYDACGQRASEFQHARTSHTLEWIIIILLLAQTIMVSIEFFSN
jgi:hypothetical protein